MTLIQEGRPWPKPRPVIVREMQQVFLGPRHPNAAVVDWHVTEISTEEARTWQEHEGDGMALPYWPLGWRPIGGLLLARSFVDGTKAAHPTSRPGAAYWPGHHGRVVAGMLPAGREFGKALLPDTGEYSLIGRVGRGVLAMVPVMIVPEISRIVVPPADAVRLERVDGAIFGALFHDAPVV